MKHVSGTLTKNEMTVTMVSTSGGHLAEVTGAGYNARGELALRAYKGRDLDVARMAVQTMLEVYIYFTLVKVLPKLGDFPKRRGPSSAPSY